MDEEDADEGEEEEEEEPPPKPAAAAAQKKKKTSVATPKKKSVQPKAAKKIAAGAGAAQSLSSSASAPSLLAKKVSMALEEDILSLSEDAASGILPECTIFSSVCMYMFISGSLALLAHSLRWLPENLTNLKMFLNSMLKFRKVKND